MPLKKPAKRSKSSETADEIEPVDLPGQEPSTPEPTTTEPAEAEPQDEAVAIASVGSSSGAELAEPCDKVTSTETDPDEIVAISKKGKRINVKKLNKLFDEDTVFQRAAEDPSTNNFLLNNTSSALTCTSCFLPKGPNQSWLDHNLSEPHIRRISDPSSGGSVQQTLKNYNRHFATNLSFVCDICQSTYNNAVHYNAHKLETEHVRRVSELRSIINLAVEKRIIKPWKPQRAKFVNSVHISRSLNASKRHQNWNATFQN